jgi:arsenate reductase-like glutaredoxin family protein
VSRVVRCKKCAETSSIEVVSIEVLAKQSKRSIKELAEINQSFSDLWENLKREHGDEFDDIFSDSFRELENNLLSSILLIGDIVKRKLTIGY